MILETFKSASVVAGLVGTIAVGAIYAEDSYNQQKDVQDIYMLMKSKEVSSHKREIRQLKKEIRLIKIKETPSLAEKTALLELADELSMVTEDLKQAVK